MASQSTKFTLQNTAYDLTQFFGVVGMHPSIGTLLLNDQFFATCTGARNWKPFIIGILAPDNPIDFIPVLRLKQELRKADQPPKLQTNKSTKVVGAGGKSEGGTILPMAYKPVTKQAMIDGLRNAWTKLNGGIPPTDALLGLLVANLLTECSATKVDKTTGQTVLPDTINPPNYNAWGYHDVGSSPPTFEAKWNPEGYYEDIPGSLSSHRWGPKGDVIPSQAGVSLEATPVGIVKDHHLYFAPQSGKSDMPRVGGKDGQAAGYYNGINAPGKRFLGVDTEGGRPYISSYAAFDSWDEAAERFASYVYNTFPKTHGATTAEEYNNAIQDRELNGGTNNFHDPDHPNLKPPIYSNKIYTEKLAKGQEAFFNSQNSTMTLSGTPGGADSTDDPSQKMMAYGSSFELDDPLAPVFGRNIEADTTRLEQIQSRMDALNTQLSLLRSVPQLILLVNPQEFKRSHENRTDFVKTRVGNIVHTWLEQPIKISASGVSAAQYAIYADMTGGLTNYNRINSIGYRNLMSLVMLYKNNGSLYDSPTGLKTTDGTAAAGDGSILIPGSMFIYYDDHVYIGSFDNLSITDAADKPHNMAYSFSFTVRYDIHVDVGVDAQMSSVLRR